MRKRVDGRRSWNAPPKMSAAVKVLQGMMEVNTDRQTGLVTLAVEWGDSVLVADWANKLIEKLNLYIKDQQMGDAQKNMEFLNRQLKSTNIAENRTILYDLIETNTKTIMLANVTDEFAFKVIDPAVVPETRIRPKRKRMVVIGGISGLLIGGFLAFLINYIKAQKNEKTVESG